VPVRTLYEERNFVSLPRFSPHIVHCVVVCCSEVLVPTIRLLVILTENTTVHHGLDSNLSCVHEKVDVN
jgi:hypothetical protein